MRRHDGEAKQGAAMDGLKALVIGLGVVIIVMVVTIAVTLANRMNPHHPAPAAAVDIVLGEPPGTHMVSVAPAGDRLAVLLQGGGPDRLLFLAPDGHVTGRVSLHQ
jgi:hypothetical protein